MIKIVLSRLGHYIKENDVKKAKEIDNSNGIIDFIKNNLISKKGIIYIPSDGSNKLENKAYSKLLFDAFKLSGIVFDNYYLIDETNKEKIDEYISSSSLVFLAGGDTYIQSEFFKDIDLKKALFNYNGILMGQSAGALNMSKNVFNSPEEKDNYNNIYFEGLGVIDINIEPHFVFSTIDFNEDEKFQRKIIIEESYKRKIYALCDGSYITFDNNDNMNIYGETYIIDKGNIVLV